MSDADDDSINRREVAYRLFAAEFEDADFSYSESDDDRSPNYVVTPTGARVNRLFVVGVLTEVQSVSEDVLRGRIVDPTGAFVAYAGQYQPDEQAFLERVDTPTFVAVTGKARTFQPDDSDQVFTSIRPESFNEVSAETRDRWSVQTAKQTLDRIGHMGAALRLDFTGDDLRQALLDEGIEDGLAAGIPLAVDHYGTTPTYLDALRGLALDALGVVADERDEVGELTAAPGQTGPVTARDIPATDVDAAKTVSAGTAQPGESSAENDTAAEPSPGSGDETATTGDGPDLTEPSSSHSESGDTGTDAAGSSEESSGSADSTGEAVHETVDTSTESIDTSAETVDTAPDSVDTSADPTDTATENGDHTDVTESEEPLEEGSVDKSSDDLGDFDPEEFDLEEETREQVKEEHGVEFQTGAEVDDPGEVDIDTPDPDVDSEDAPEMDEESSAADPADDSGTDRVPQDDTPSADSSDEAAEDGPDSPETPDDVKTTLVELMAELDDGDGAQREALFSEMSEQYGVGENEVQAAIESALMDGECYEPGDGRFKPI